ncbi:50S ribosomal protein L28 [Helicovermis profundi]|uniref:Large ribosomal subunit protein bL28 n=1 Tax=Helicovermis profundi TaxID=3065157 RepID=A0AAU9E5V3_9FIRM|nr:50S ribosomal protein L28 [Clostridia bacterium S502]
MAKICAVCGKGKMSGNHVSHANNHNRRTWAPNLKRVRAVVEGSNKRITVCTRCLRSGKVERAL